MNINALKIAPLLLVVGLWACSEASEAPRVELPVQISSAGLVPVQNDLGYQVELTRVRVAIRDLGFSVAGELHASLWQRVSDALAPQAWAHPGHSAGGEVTGELPGNFIIDWLREDGRELGHATLLAGTYTSANFVFARASEAQLDPGDPLIGHTAIFEGIARRAGVEIPFAIFVDSPADRALIGAPLTRPGRIEPGKFRAVIDADARGTLRLQMDVEDIIEHKILFDALDFDALPADEDGVVRIVPDVAAVEQAYNVFRRKFQLVDHYIVYYQE